MQNYFYLEIKKKLKKKLKNKKTRNKKITYFCLSISYLVPGYLKGRFCYLRGFYLETNEHRPVKKKYE